MSSSPLRANPIRVTATRSIVESEHLVDAAIVGPSGTEAIWGDGERLVIPRSAIKSVQAIPLIRSGAADAFDVADHELALAGSSHSSEPDHIEAVEAWLARIGCSVEDLECGAQRPIDANAGDALISNRVALSRVHHCCSGKHTGFLTLARHLGVDTAGYRSRDHPVQELVEASIVEHTGFDVADQVAGVDGCGIPTFGIPLVGLARAMAQLPKGDAGARMSSALAANPWWVSGTNRPEVTITADAVEPLVMKGGAEGVFMAALPARSIGIACKARDGAARAVDVAIGALLAYTGAVGDHHGSTALTNAAGTVVGELRAHLP